MHAFDVLGDPVRRRLLELLADGETSAGGLTDVIRAEFGITQPAVSRHLKVLRENGFADVRAEGTRRLYVVRAEPLRDVDAWLARYRGFWDQRLDALETELVRSRRQRATAVAPAPETHPVSDTDRDTDRDADRDTDRDADADTDRGADAATDQRSTP